MYHWYPQHLAKLVAWFLLNSTPISVSVEDCSVSIKSYYVKRTQTWIGHLCSCWKRMDPLHQCHTRILSAMLALLGVKLHIEIMVSMRRLKCTLHCIRHTEINSKNGASNIVVMMTSVTLGQLMVYIEFVKLKQNQGIVKFRFAWVGSREPRSGNHFRDSPLPSHPGQYSYWVGAFSPPYQRIQLSLADWTQT